MSTSTRLQHLYTAGLFQCPKTPAPRSKSEQDPPVLLTLMELSLSRVCQSFTFLSVLLVSKRFFLWEKGWWNSPTTFPQNKLIHFRCFQLKLKLFLSFFSTPWLHSLPASLLLVCPPKRSWCSGVSTWRLLKGPTHAMGGIKKKEEEIIRNFQDPGQTPAYKLCVSLPKLSSFALSLSAGGCWESGPARYRLGESGEGVQEGLALFTFVTVSQDHADHMGSYCGRMC